MNASRRTFLATAATAAASAVSYSATGADKTDRPTFGLIGCGYQSDTKRKGRGIAIGNQAAKLGDIATICEIDTTAAEYALANVGDGRARLVEDYRQVIEDKEIDAVLIATPDHWHTKIAVEAMMAGKDVYCEKPVATKIEEGKLLRKIVRQTSRVFQVGTQQRSEYKRMFLQAIAMIREGRVGTLRKIRIGLQPGWEGGPFQSTEAPTTLNWNQWLGPAPETSYIKERTHRTFRWWYEYAGGQICDWGAHHVDIAQWAIGMEDSGPVSVSGTAKMNQPLVGGMPTRDDTYNTPIDFRVTCQFFNNVEFVIDASRNGITFEGDEGRFFVNRGTLEGKPVDALKTTPLEDGALEKLYPQLPESHMQNFVDCLRTRQQPISDIGSHHRTLTTCHLANIALRLGRKVVWDAEQEVIVGDDEATALMSRSYRKGFEIEGV